MLVETLDSIRGFPRPFRLISADRDFNGVACEMEVTQ